MDSRPSRKGTGVRRERANWLLDGEYQIAVYAVLNGQRKISQFRLSPFSLLFPLLDRLIGSVDVLFWEWKKRFKNRTELPVSRRPYSLDDQGVTVGAGIIQIVHYANETSDNSLVTLFLEVQRMLKTVRSEFFDLNVNGLGYFGVLKKPAGFVVSASKPPGASEAAKGQLSR